MILPLIFELFHGPLIKIILVELLRNGIQDWSMTRFVFQVLKMEDVTFQKLQILLQLVNLFRCAMVRYLDQRFFEFLHVHQLLGVLAALFEDLHEFRLGDFKDFCQDLVAEEQIAMHGEILILF